MTDFKDEKPTPRQPRFSSQKEDFDLVDMRVMPEQTDLTPSPLDHITDDEELGIDHRITPNNFALAESLMPSTQAVSEIKTSFYVDYFDKRKKIKSAKQNPDPLPVVEVNQASTVANEEHPEPHQTEDVHLEQPLESHTPVVNGSGLTAVVLSQFKSKQESINKQQEKLIQDFAKKIKKATAVTYTAVFFGIASLAAATALGIMLLKTKSEISDLAGTTTALKDDIRNIKTLPDDLEGTDPSIDQLNQKVEDVAERLNEVTALQNKVALLEKATTSKQATAASTKSPDNPQVTVVDMAEKKPTETTVRTTSTLKPPKTQTTPATPANSKPSNKTSTAKKDIPDKTNAVPANDINNVANTTNPKTISANTAQTSTSPQTASGGWTVNLASSNRLEDAKNTAARFAQKGVPVTITPVTVKNETRYRLQVKGFKNKDEAAAYANKAKEALNLNSVWINP